MPKFKLTTEAASLIKDACIILFCDMLKSFLILGSVLFLVIVSPFCLLQDLFNWFTNAEAKQSPAPESR